jgi:predicted transcriptional regulator YdeE
MQRPELVHKPAIKIIGIATRTTNDDEASSATAKIPGMWARFYQENISEKVPNKVDPDRVLAVYTDYESDEQGAYTYILGFEVASFEQVPEGMLAKELPASTYTVFTSRKGPVPQIILDTWQEIWQASRDGLARSFSGDFEVYDARSHDPQYAEIDIYIAVDQAR